MSNLKLRPYQEECLEAISTAQSEGYRRVLVSLPTASGKTVIFASMLAQTCAKAIIFAHTSELLEQARDKINMIAPHLEVGLVNGVKKELDRQIVVSSIQSASRQPTLNQLIAQKFNLAIIDECHHASSDSYRQTLDAMGFGKGTDKLVVGYTATPFRNDFKGLGEDFDVVAYEKPIKSMIDEGFLCNPRGVRVVTDLDLTEVKTTHGDYEAASLAELMDTEQMMTAVVNAYIQHAAGRPTLCFGTTVAHAEHLARAFNAAGIRSGVVHGGMDYEERSAVLNNYRTSQISVLCNCQVLTEGFDAPETSCVIVARPTRSKGLYQQIVGRGLRLWPNKNDCIVLDFGDRHHTLCSVTTLLKDAEGNSYNSDTEKLKEQEVALRLPPQLNQKLKTAILQFDPIGDAFSWERDEHGAYFLRGSGKTRLEVIPQGDAGHAVIMTKPYEHITIASGLTFEYAFAAAEDYAKANRKLFVVSDIEAGWRKLPITDRQLACIRRSGYRAGIEALSRGQAAMLISSGALRRSC